MGVGEGITVDNSIHTKYSNRTNQYFNNNMQSPQYTFLNHIVVNLSSNINLGFGN